MSAFQETSKASGSSEETEQVRGHLEENCKKDAGDAADAILDWLGTVIAKDFSQADEDELNRMLDELNAIDPEPDSVDVQVSLAQFHQKYAPLFEDAESPASELKTAIPAPASEKQPHRISKRLGLIAACIAFTFMLMVPARATVFQFLSFIARTTAEIFHFDQSDATYATIQTYPIAEGEEATYETLQAALNAFGIDAPLAPMEIPERFGQPTIITKRISSGVRIYVDYAQGDNFLSIHFTEFDGQDLGVFETNSDGANTYRRGGFQHFISTDQTAVKVMWQNGELECCITGTISEQEAKDIINSIYEE